MSAFFTTILFIPIYNMLMYLVAVVPGHQVALAIIALTIIIRIILLPSSLKASKSTIEMQKIQPLLNAVKVKFKGDQMKQSQEMQRLFKEHKVSPYGSCLPLIVQMIVLIVFYRVILIGFNSGHFNLLYSFIPKPAEINLRFLGINVSKPDLWLLPILAGALQFVQTKMMPQPPQSKGANDPMAMMNKQMIYFFPLITIFIARALPSGLAIYWVITSAVMILQQWYINNQFKLGFWGKFPAVPISELPEYTIDTASTSAGTELHPEHEKIIEADEKKIRAKGVEITVRKRK
ncbi:MAG: YidC/Oxa1 family membrane protein insertase [Candidatus Berkelbacteria bacterium]|nr:YidC/Oxa1 family membrane protein insertase [Candidatus Berkelbacteria bacterium]